MRVQEHVPPLSGHINTALSRSEAVEMADPRNLEAWLWSLSDEEFDLAWLPELIDLVTRDTLSRRSVFLALAAVRERYRAICQARKLPALPPLTRAMQYGSQSRSIRRSRPR